MGEHSAPPPRPQDWEEAVGVNADYGEQSGAGLKEGLARMLEDPGYAPMPVDAKYKGAKESLKTLFPEVARIKTTVQNALGRLAIWRTAQPEAPSEQQQIDEAHHAMQAVADEITQEHEVLQVTIPNHTNPATHSPTRPDTLHQASTNLPSGRSTKPLENLARLTPRRYNCLSTNDLKLTTTASTLARQATIASIKTRKRQLSSHASQGTLDLKG